MFIWTFRFQIDQGYGGLSLSPFVMNTLYIDFEMCTKTIENTNMVNDELFSTEIKRNSPLCLFNARTVENNVIWSILFAVMYMRFSDYHREIEVLLEQWFLVPNQYCSFLKTKDKSEEPEIFQQIFQ